MRILIGVIIVISCLSTYLAPPAQTAEVASLDMFIKQALESNPEILSAKRAYEAADARISQVASLNDPIIELEYDKMTADRMLTGDPMKSYAVSQEIPFPTKLYLRAKIASKIAKMEYENYKAKEQEIISQVKSTYAALFLVYKSIDSAKENKSILEQFSAVTTKRYSTDEGTQADALRAQLELAKVDTQLIMLEQNRVTAQARLNILINKDPKEELGIPLAERPISFTQPLDEFYTLVKQNNPELKAYRYAIERGQAALDLSVNEYMPDVMLKFKQMINKGQTSSDAWAGMVGVTIPLWFFQKQSFGVKEMRSELEMLKAEYKSKENRVLFDVRDAYARADANKKIIELYETSFIPQAEETAKATMKGYESGKADFLSLLDAQRMVIDFKLDHYRAILELRIAFADLERLVGLEFEALDRRSAYEKK